MSVNSCKKIYHNSLQPILILKLNKFTYILESKSHLHNKSNPLPRLLSDIKFVRLLITKNIYWKKKNISIVRRIIFFSRIYNAETIRFFDTPFKYDSQELSPRNKREQFLISQLSWLPFVGQQLATNFPRPRIHRTSGSCATVQVRCFPTKCFPLRFFYSIIRDWGRATE